MKMLKLTIVLSLLTATFAFGAASAPQATIVAVKGAATYTPASGGKSQPVTKGATIAEGGSVDTSAGGEVSVKFFDGTVTVIQNKTSVTLETLKVTAGKEVTQLNLRSGSLVATLDPAKKDVSDYKVRTPKGVAAARGTVFQVRVDVTGGSTVATMAGTVTFTGTLGNFTINLTSGQVTNGAGATMTLAAAVASTPGLAADLASAAAAVATAVGQGAIQNSAPTPQNVAAVLAAVTQIAVQAAPDNRAAIVQTVTSNSGATGAITAAVNQAANVGSALAKTDGTSKGSSGAASILPPLDTVVPVTSTR